MDKYKKTAGLNYLSENSYKGDGSPGMVMGIASDARGDTNTNEAQKPTTNSKHSSERDLKKYDPAHGHTKPEGGNPQVCHLCKGEGCEPCGHTGEEITKVRNDPKVDETKHSELDDIKRLSGLTEAFAWDELEEAKRKKRPDLDDLEDEEEKPEDPDSDKVQHILMQLRKAKDVDGDHPIKFLDGTKIKLPVADIDLFMDKYMDMKPLDREKMQQVAVMSKEQFDTILSFFQPKHGKLEKSIYEDEEII